MSLPPDPDDMNSTRAASANLALHEFMRQMGVTDPEEGLRDLLVISGKGLLLRGERR